MITREGGVFVTKGGGDRRDHAGTLLTTPDGCDYYELWKNCTTVNRRLPDSY